MHQFIFQGKEFRGYHINETLHDIPKQDDVLVTDEQNLLHWNNGRWEILLIPERSKEIMLHLIKHGTVPDTKIEFPTHPDTSVSAQDKINDFFKVLKV
jgi:hypothetical protein